MTRATIGLVTLLLASGAWAQETALPVPATEPVRVVEQTVSLGNTLLTLVSIGISDVVVKGDDVDQLSARLLIFCDRKPEKRAKCEEQARDVAIRAATDGDRLEVGIRGVSSVLFHRLRFRLEIVMPKGIALEARVRSGQVRIDDLLANITAKVGRGTVDISLPDGNVRELDLGAGGEAMAQMRGETVRGSGGLFSRLRWERPEGLVRIKADVDIGDIRVVLR